MYLDFFSTKGFYKTPKAAKCSGRFGGLGKKELSSCVNYQYNKF